MYMNNSDSVYLEEWRIITSLPFAYEGSTRVMHLGVCVFLSVCEHSSKSIGPIDVICFKQEGVYPWLGPSLDGLGSVLNILFNILHHCVIGPTSYALTSTLRII